MDIMKINTKLIPLKAFFFCNYAAAGALLPFLTVHLKRLGISAAEAGVIAGFTQLFSIFSRPAAGAMADHHHKHKPLLLFMLLSYGITYFTLMLVPERQDVQKSDSVNVSCLELSHEQWTCFSVQYDLLYSCNASSESVNTNYTVHDANYDSNSTGFHTSCRSRHFRNGITVSNSSELFKNNINGSRTSRNFRNNITSFSSYSSLSNNIIGSIQFNDSMFRPISCVKENKMDIWEFLNNETLREDLYNCTLFDNHQLHPKHSDWRFDMTLILCFVLVLLARVSYSCLQSLLDTITYFMLGSDRFLYSRQRLWGTAGTAFSASCVIFVIDAYYDVIFYMFGSFCLLAFVAGLTLYVQPEKRNHINLTEILKQQAMQPYVRWFLVKIFIYGLFLGAAINFLFWFFKDIGVSGSFLGIVTLIHCLSSLIVLQAAPKILKRFGQDMCMYAALCVYCVRFLGHSFVQDHWVILPLELLRGVSYALFWAAASSKISLLAPSGSQGTFQGLAGAVYNDLGRGLGSIVTGVLFEKFDERWTFRAYAILCIVLLVIFCCLDRVWNKPVETKKDELMNGDLLIDPRKIDEVNGENVK